MLKQTIQPCSPVLEWVDRDRSGKQTQEGLCPGQRRGVSLRQLTWDAATQGAGRSVGTPGTDLSHLHPQSRPV